MKIEKVLQTPSSTRSQAEAVPRGEWGSADKFAETRRRRRGELVHGADCVKQPINIWKFWEGMGCWAMSRCGYDRVQTEPVGNL